MSQVKVSGNASGTGILTIAAPNTNSDYTLTLPAETGTVVTTGSTAGVSQSMLASNVAGTGPSGVMRLNAAGAYSATNNTYTKVPFDTVDFDTNGCFNATGSTVTLNGISVPSYSFAPNVAGYYLVTGAVGLYSLTAGTSTRLVVSLYKNGAQSNYLLFYNGLTSTSYSASGSAIIYLNGTSDYISLYANQNQGSDKPFDYSSYNHMSVCLIRKA